MCPILATALVGLASLQDPPQALPPIAAGFPGQELEIFGTGFGSPSPTSGFLWWSGSVFFLVPSTSPIVTAWEDERIAIALPPNTPSGYAIVGTPAGLTAPIRLDVFDYDWFDIPPTPGTSAAPLAIEVDSTGRVWVNQEFHREFQMLDPSVGQVVGLPIPMPPDPGVFAITIFSDHPTQISVLGEDILVDPQGRVWFSQGGASLYSGAHPNHSRIVCYDESAPPGSQYRVYNAPGDRNEVIGLLWDPIREWIWYANGGLSHGAELVGFDPEKVPFDNHFDFSTDLLEQLCYPGEPEDACYHTYPLPNAGSHPAHMLIDEAGGIWWTGFWGRAIGRLDPDTGVVREFPVADQIGQSNPSIFVGPGPWEILFDPSGDVIFCEFFDSTISRFDTSRLFDPACLELDPSGDNPCIEEFVIPRADPMEDTVHSIAYDHEGNLWYTIHGDKDTGGTESVGYFTPGLQHAVRLSPLELFPGTGSASNAGIAVCPLTGDIWFNEFFRKRIGRLRRSPDLP